MNTKDIIIALIVPLSWGLGFVAAKSGLGHFPPLLLMALRFALSSFLIIWFVPIPTGYLKRIFFIAFVSATIQYGLTFSGLAILDASTASLLVQTEVAFGIIVAAIFLREIPTKKEFIGIVIAFCGTILLLGTPSLEGKMIGAILVLSGAFCWSVGQVMIKGLRGNVKGLTLICWIGIFCTPQMMFLSAIIDGNPIPYILSANLKDWFTVIYLGLIMTVLGYSIWFYILTKYPIPIAMPFLLLIPVSAILGAMIFFGDRPNFDILLGGGIIVFGLAVIIIEPKILFTKLKTGR